MSVTFAVQLRGRPLRGAEEHGVRHAQEVDVRVHCQNSVVRVLDGGFPVPVEVTQEFQVTHNGVININTEAEQQDHFRVLEQCQIVYDSVFRQFSPFNRSRRRAFPFGQAAGIAATRNRTPRVEVVYPDNGPSPLAFVEPVSVGTLGPLMHINTSRSTIDSSATRTWPPPSSPTSLPTPCTSRSCRHPRGPRWRRSTWPGSPSARPRGLPPFHNTTAATTRFVAWIEALGLFAERFHIFGRNLEPPLTGVALRQAFFRDELSASPDLASAGIDGYLQVGKVGSAGDVVATVTGDTVEGAVYGAVFLDLARRFGLREMVGHYLNSAVDNVLTFDDFSNLLISDTDLDAGVLEARQTWQL